MDRTNQEQPADGSGVKVTVGPNATTEVTPPPAGATGSNGAASVQEDQFTFRMKNGSIVVCGKPRGVLKLRLRDLVPKESLDDRELMGIASAVLSIRTVDGAPLWVKDYNHFEAFVNRFSDDDELDEFMKLYNELTNPAMMSAVEAAMKEADERGLSRPDQIEALVFERVQAAAKAEREKVRDS